MFSLLNRLQIFMYHLMRMPVLAASALSFRTKLILTAAIITILFFLFNLFTRKYQASSYIGFNNLLVMLPAYGLYLFSKQAKQSYPSLSFVPESLWAILCVTFVMNFFTVVIQYTPFKLHDEFLQQLDLWLGFSTVKFVNWFHQYPKFISLITVAYSTNIKQLVVTPLLLAILQQRRRFDVFLNATLIAFIIGYLIYYFFPSAGPGAILVDPHFTQRLYSAGVRFYDVQHYIFNDDLSDGIIAFPSFHTIWAISVLYAWKNYKVIFYPLLIWNSLVIIATLALGEHFLVDVIMGALIAIFSIAVAEKRSSHQDYSFNAMVRLYKLELKS